MTKHLRCAKCNRTYGLEPLFNGCPHCDGALEVDYDYVKLSGQINGDWWRIGQRAQGIWRYATLLPIDDPIRAISLGEGNTPLVKSRNVGPQHGLNALYYKNETVNPTWAQKDRCHTIMITKAHEFGYRRVVTTSTGNHGASAAAYSAVAGMEACVVLCPPETSELLLRFINSFGGTALVADWNGRADLLRYLVSERDWYPTTGLGAGIGTNPYGVEGYKSIAYEIVEQLGGVPDRVVMSIASGDSFYGVWKGFREMHVLGRINRLPRMWGCQPSGADVVARSLAEGRAEPLVLDAPRSIAISTREPTSGAHALRTIRESGGGATTVDDEAIMSAVQLIGRDGLCCEPSSALTLAAVLKLAEHGEPHPDEQIVCVVTAAGIKWPSVLLESTSPARRVESTIPALRHALADLL